MLAFLFQAGEPCPSFGSAGVAIAGHMRHGTRDLACSVADNQSMNTSFRQPSYASSQPLAPSGRGYGSSQMYPGVGNFRRSQHGATYQGSSGLPQGSQLYRSVFGAGGLGPHGVRQNPFHADAFYHQHSMDQMRQQQAYQQMADPNYLARRQAIFPFMG